MSFSGERVEMTCTIDHSLAEYCTCLEYAISWFVCRGVSAVEIERDKPFVRVKPSEFSNAVFSPLTRVEDLFKDGYLSNELPENNIDGDSFDHDGMSIVYDGYRVSVVGNSHRPEDILAAVTFGLSGTAVGCLSRGANIITFRLSRYGCQAIFDLPFDRDGVITFLEQPGYFDHNSTLQSVFGDC